MKKSIVNSGAEETSMDFHLMMERVAAAIREQKTTHYAKWDAAKLTLDVSGRCLQMILFVFDIDAWDGGTGHYALSMTGPRRKEPVHFEYDNDEDVFRAVKQAILEQLAELYRSIDDTVDAIYRHYEKTHPKE